jgi:hypothetical protein
MTVSAARQPVAEVAARDPSGFTPLALPPGRELPGARHKTILTAATQPGREQPTVNEPAKNQPKMKKAAGGPPRVELTNV